MRKASGKKEGALLEFWGEDFRKQEERLLR